MNTFSHAKTANHARASVFSRMLNQAGVLLLIALFPALLAGMLHPRKPAWSRERMSLPEVTVEQIARWESSVLFVDARKEADYRKQHVPGAIWLNEDHWEEQLPVFLQVWQPGVRVVVYCDAQGCNLSQSVARRLRRDADIGEIFVLKGGWNAWLKAQKQRN